MGYHEIPSPGDRSEFEPAQQELERLSTDLVTQIRLIGDKEASPYTEGAFQYSYQTEDPELVKDFPDTYKITLIVDEDYPLDDKQIISGVSVGLYQPDDNLEMFDLSKDDTGIITISHWLDDFQSIYPPDLSVSKEDMKRLKQLAEKLSYKQG